MSFFDQVYQKLFPEREAKNEVILYEPIKRGDQYLDDFIHWKNSYKRTDTVRRVAESYRLKSGGLVGEPDVHLLNSSLSNGFAVSFHDQIGERDFQYLFDWMAEKVEGLGYKRANSDIQVTDKNTYVEACEKHYLKPIQSKAGDEKRFDQAFGNILIEHIIIDGKPTYIKLIANTYNDRMYKKAVDFDILAEYLFEVA